MTWVWNWDTLGAVFLSFCAFYFGPKTIIEKNWHCLEACKHLSSFNLLSFHKLFRGVVSGSWARIPFATNKIRLGKGNGNLCGEPYHHKIGEPTIFEIFSSDYLRKQRAYWTVMVLDKKILIIRVHGIFNSFPKLYRLLQFNGLLINSKPLN